MSVSSPKSRDQAKPSFNLHLAYIFFYLISIFSEKFMIQQNIKQFGFGWFLAWLVTLSPETRKNINNYTVYYSTCSLFMTQSTNGSWYRLLLSCAFPVSRCLVYVYKSGPMPSDNYVDVCPLFARFAGHM